MAIANEEQIGVLNNLKEIKIALQKIAPFSIEYQTLLERITSLIIEFDDISDELTRCSEKLFNDPEQLDLISQKLQVIFNLQKKHQVNTVDELLEIQNQLENSIFEIGNLEAEIATLTHSIQEKIAVLDTLSSVIHDKREVAVPVLSQKLIAILETLGMSNVRFNIDVNLSPTYFQNGKDEIQFLFSANKGLAPKPFRQIASGGEMSRLMLSIKHLLAEKRAMPTLILDEIDTGVSGEIAIKIGQMLTQMSQGHQLIAITHLPQIAAAGNSHWYVYKDHEGEKTVSSLRKLEGEERIDEIAKMIGGQQGYLDLKENVRKLILANHAE